MKNFKNNNRRRFGSRGSRFFSNKNTKKENIKWMTESALMKLIDLEKSKPAVVAEESYANSYTFVDFGFADQLINNINKKGYTIPFPIQDQAIPVIMSGRDLIGLANTGTGKTAAFLIPLINKVFKDKTQKVLIIAPTRELASQINIELKELTNGMRIYSALLIGGDGIQRQIREIRMNPQFVVATPGRLRDILSRKVLKLDLFNNVVLDETDRMLDIGFVKEIKEFISLMSNNRQSLFFSATITNKVEEIINMFVKDPVKISVKMSDVNKNIQQDYVCVKKEIKIDYLHDLLIQESFKKVIIFRNTKWNVQNLTDELRKRGFKADSIHGDKRQNKRHAILEKFKKDEIKILVATDVAARGLDINNVSHVINYEIPQSYDDYVHRIGRTGRADKQGFALTFVNSIERKTENR